MGIGQGTLENLVENSVNTWQNQAVFVTGHTGFKGSWLSLYLKSLGARVHGFSLAPPTQPAIFNEAGVAEVLASDVRADLADLAALTSALKSAQPEVVFHLAAQALVRTSYSEPIGTFATNVLGTANLLQAARSVQSIKAIVIVTTDKVYHNREWVHPYREDEPLGGHDPYSASKAAAEIITASMRSSFFQDNNVNIATARAGNVIGGGDWAADRLIPDCLQSFAKAAPVRLRFSQAVRPWQHVLEPLTGYLVLAAALLKSEGECFAKAWNFGPDTSDHVTVGTVASKLAKLWGDSASVICESHSGQPHEAGLLALDNSAARHHLNWRPRWSLDEALHRTVSWHEQWLAGGNMQEITISQIKDYKKLSET
jgi:CDP-glucose 4,6-dehydratase